MPRGVSTELCYGIHVRYSLRKEREAKKQQHRCNALVLSRVCNVKRISCQNQEIVIYVKEFPPKQTRLFKFSNVSIKKNNFSDSFQRDEENRLKMYMVRFLSIFICVRVIYVICVGLCVLDGKIKWEIFEIFSPRISSSLWF